MLANRSTRSGRTFSPYTPEEIDPLCLPATYDPGPALKTAILEQCDRAVDVEYRPQDQDHAMEQAENQVHEFLAAEQQQAAHPLALLDEYGSNSDADNDKDVQVFISTGPPICPASTSIDRPQKPSHVRRAKKRAMDKPTKGHPAGSKMTQKIISLSNPVPTELSSKDLPVAHGAYEAVREAIRGYKVLMTPSKGLVYGLRLVRINPSVRRVIPILDANGYVQAVMCPPIGEASYDAATYTALDAILEEGRRAIFTKAERHHRRGAFPALNFGVYHGNGTLQPINLDNGSHTAMLDRLCSRKDVQRIATHGSAIFQFWNGGVYNHFNHRLTKLYEKRPDLVRIFPRSIYPTAAVNFGPRVCTYKHRDLLNCPYGWCMVHALGHFDHTRGGHIILWEFGLMIEMPHGYTLGVPSATVIHSNSPVAKHETRVSFTQFCPGGLLRYVDHGFRTEDKFAEEDPSGYAQMCREKHTRWEDSLKLLTRYQDILDRLRKAQT